MKRIGRYAWLRRWLGTVAVALALVPWPGYADEQWTAGREFALRDPEAQSTAPSPSTDQVVAVLSPGSIVVAQAGGAPAEGKNGKLRWPRTFGWRAPR